MVAASVEVWCLFLTFSHFLECFAVDVGCIQGDRGRERPCLEVGDERVGRDAPVAHGVDFKTRERSEIDRAESRVGKRDDPDVFRTLHAPVLQGRHGARGQIIVREEKHVGKLGLAVRQEFQELFHRGALDALG